MMKRFALFVPILGILTGCAQLFNGNAFQTVDQPASLDANALAGDSDSTIVSEITYNSSFLKQLQSNSAALTAVQTVLSNGYNSSTASTTTKITDAQAYITATTGGTSLSSVVTTAMAQATTLASGASTSTAAAALTAIFAGETTAQIQANLQQLENISGALSVMQTAATSGTTVSSTTFFGSSTSKLSLAVTAALAATVNAFVADDGMSTLVNALASGTTPSYSGSAVGQLSNALSGSGSNPATNNYAYLTAVTGLIKT